MRWVAATGLLACAMALAGCGGDDGPAGEVDAGGGSDAGGGMDAGDTPDAGGRADAGPEEDAGSVGDAGMEGDGGSGEDGGTTTDAGTDDDAGTSDAGLDVMCPSRFPTFDRSCTTADDCVAVTHQTDCCGNTRVMGIAAPERSRFDAAEAICRSQYPACGCPAGPPRADDGTVGTFGETPDLTCDSGTCTTSFP